MGFISDFFARFAGRTVYIGGISARSRPWSRSVETQEICRSILDCNASHTAKGQVLHVVMDDRGRVKEIKRSSNYTKLFMRPNPMMTSYDFLYAMSWQLDLKNTAMAWIQWDERMQPAAIWPIAYGQFEIRGVIGGGYAVQFNDMDGAMHTLPLEDVVLLRRHYDGSGVAGEDNGPVQSTIDMVTSLDAGLTDAVNVSNKIHGILKSKKAMLSPDFVKQGQADFISRMKSAADGGGIVAVDASEDYVPINVTTWAANAAQMQQITNRLYAYWRTPPEVVNNSASEQTMQNYYDSIIEPRWAEMSAAFTAALFSRQEQDRGNRILMFGGAATGASWTTKLAIITDVKETGLLTVNEQRELLGYAPVEDGDQRLVSLNYIKSTDQSQYQTGAATSAPAANANGGNANV